MKIYNILVASALCASLPSMVVAVSPALFTSRREYTLLTCFCLHLDSVSAAAAQVMAIIGRTKVLARTAGLQS